MLQFSVICEMCQHNRVSVTEIARGGADGAVQVQVECIFFSPMDFLDDIFVLACVGCTPHMNFEQNQIFTGWPTNFFFFIHLLSNNIFVYALSNTSQNQKLNKVEALGDKTDFRWINTHWAMDVCCAPSLRFDLCLFYFCYSPFCTRVTKAELSDESRKMVKSNGTGREENSIQCKCFPVIVKRDVTNTCARSISVTAIASCRMCVRTIFPHTYTHNTTWTLVHSDIQRHTLYFVDRLSQQFNKKILIEFKYAQYCSILFFINYSSNRKIQISHWSIFESSSAYFQCWIEKPENRTNSKWNNFVTP